MIANKGSDGVVIRAATDFSSHGDLHKRQTYRLKRYVFRCAIVAKERFGVSWFRIRVAVVRLQRWRRAVLTDGDGIQRYVVRRFDPGSWWCVVLALWRN